MMGKKIIAICLTAFLALAIYAAEPVTSISYPGGSFRDKQYYGPETAIDGQKFVCINVEWEIKDVSTGNRSYPIAVFSSKGKVVRSMLLNNHMGFSGGYNPKKLSVKMFEGNLKIPANADKVQVVYCVAGNAVEIANIKTSIEWIDEIPKVEYGPLPALKSKAKVLTDEELDQVLAKRVKAVPELKQEGDAVRLYINGKPVSGTIYLTTSWVNTRREHQKLYEGYEFSQNGFNFFTVKLNLRANKMRGTTGVWLGDKKYDMELVRQRIRHALRANPDGMVFLTFTIAPYVGWEFKNPDENYQMEDGRYGLYDGKTRIAAYNKDLGASREKGYYPQPSYASEKYRQAAAVALRDIISAVEKMPEGKAVVGTYLCGGTDGQWLDLWDNHTGVKKGSFDYSPAGKKAFASYVKQKYGSLDAANKVWGTDFKSFDTMKYPVHSDYWNYQKTFLSEGGSSMITDMTEFSGYVGALRAKAFAKAVKDGSNGRLLTGGYAPQGGMSGYPLISAQNARWLLNIKELDFLNIVPLYKRNFDDPILNVVFNGSLRHHNKLCVVELDLRNPSVLNWGVWGTDLWYRTHDSGTFRTEVLKFVTNALSRGGYYHAYDMEGGWYNTPDARKAWTEGNKIAAEAKPLKLDSNRIGVVSGGRFWDFQSFGKDRLAAYFVNEYPIHALAKSGVPHDFYLLDDLLNSEIKALPKVLLFTDASIMTKAQLDTLLKKYGKDGRIMVFFWRPGMFTTDAKVMADYFGLKRTPEADKKWLVAGDSKDPLMKDVKGFLLATHRYDFFPEAWAPVNYDGKVLACYQGTDIPGMTVKRKRGYTEVMIAQPGAFTPQMCRNFAKEAGFSPLVEEDALVSYGFGVFSLLPLKDGEKKVTLPENVTVSEVTTGQKIAQNGNTFTVNLKRGEIFVALIENK